MENEGKSRAMNMDGKTRVCGIIANPVEHSMSPLLQNLYAEQTGVNLVYVPYRVEEERLKEAVKGAHALNICGLNVTVPHKQSVMNYLAEIDETARDIGAVNTLVWTKDGYKGYNTDVPGLLRAMREAHMELRGRKCILIGAGGAAKAAAYMMAKEEAETVYLLNRSVNRAEELADWVNQMAGRELVIPLALSEHGRIPDGRYLAVQTTSVGMHPKTEAAPIEDRSFYKKIEEAFDVIYTPSRTKFMEYVEEAGGRVINGLNMLLYQGVISYELWNPGVTVEKETIAQARRLIEKKLEEKREILILIGFMGAGKTSVGRAYSEKTGLALFDTDQMIEEAAGMSISEIFSTQGEEVFRQMETKLLQKLIREKDSDDGFVLSVGGGLPLSEENRELLKKLGRVVYLKVSAETVLERLKGDTTRPLLRGDDVRARVEGLLETRGPLYEQAAHRILSVDGKEISHIVDEIGFA